jgi:hypothetical protein
MADDIIPGSNDGIREIGRISKLRSDIDPPEHSDSSLNISTQLKYRMSVIDLIPCQFNISLSTILKSDNSDFSDKFIPDITYKKAVEDYNWMLWSYGLDSCDFLRLYLTDMTSSTDEMSNTYDKNFMDSTLDSLTSSKIGQILQTIGKTTKSVGAGSPDKSGEYISRMPDPIKSNFSSGVLEGLSLAEDVLTHGTKISFPKIWMGSDFSPNLSCNVKLVSPYGHPDAINEFIIKPLCYLLILLSPTTTQGITINRPNYLTLKSYGLANFSLCYPKSMSIRRGGDDSSYNQYCQPMTVDINLTFETVTAGFACFKSFKGMDGQAGEKHPEADLFGENSDLGTEDYENDFTQPNSLFPTLRSVINSFRPKGNSKASTTSTPVPPPMSTGGGVSPDPSTNLDLSTALSTNSLSLFAPPTGGRIIVS